MNDSVAECCAGSRCKLWKTCIDCQHIRQAQIASVAESGASTSRKISFAVIRTSSPKNIHKDKARLMRSLKNQVDGGVWTIETGKVSTGLHLNIIAGADHPVDAARFAKYWSSDANIVSKEVPRAEVRNVAAYISKGGETVPQAGEYSGRLYGSFGTWKKPLAVAAGQTIAPILAGLAQEQILSDLGIEAPEVRATPYGVTDADKNEWNKQMHMRRLLAVYADQINVEGYVFVPGYGIAGKKELEQCGLSVSDK